MVPGFLTEEEVAFLARQGFAEDEIYDARFESSADWKVNAKRLGFDLVLGSPCQKAGHRIRTRAGHCVQCDTSKIAYVTRHNRPGYVYVAASPSGRFLKIGSALELEQRERNLRNHRYGGYADWIIIGSAWVDNRGQTEQAALRSVQHRFEERTYFKDGKDQVTRELIRSGLQEVLTAFVAAIKADNPQRMWRHRRLEEFDYPLP